MISTIKSKKPYIQQLMPTKDYTKMSESMDLFHDWCI